MPHREPVARRLCELVEPIHLVTYFAPEPTEALTALGLRGYWDGYFAGRAGPLGPVSAELVHAIFYNFADGEVARHIPRIWGITTPDAALAARERGAAAALRRILGGLADDPRVARAADLATRAATGAPTEGRPLYAALRTLAVPTEPLARLWHAATLLREHRGDGHIAALMADGVGGAEAHWLHAVAQGMPGHEFGRIHHLPASHLSTVGDRMRTRGLIDDEGLITALGRETKDRVEKVTDELAEPAYAVLEPSELDQLVADLRPIAAALDAAGSH
jgi:hypothetical protein